ncbi:MAG: FHA domain-containing protein [Deltaproteobacteria bacterium]|nr:FHA domain-containing protein [Deltaproteobacteria bacterium]
MIRLVVMDGVDRGKTFEFEDETSFVGRSFRNHVILEDGSVSNRHLKVFRIGRKCFVEDLKSTNGTHVNGKRLAPGEGFEVEEGDLIRLGRTVMRIEALPAQSAVERAAASGRGKVQRMPPSGAAHADRRQRSNYGARLVCDVSALMKQSLGLHSFCRKVLECILENLPRIDTAVVVYLDPLKRKLKNKTLILYSRPELEYHRGRLVSEKIIDQVLERGRPVRVVNAASQHHGDLDDRPGKNLIRSILCIPLVSNSVLRGTLYVHSTSYPCGFREEDFLILDTVGTLLALALENALTDGETGRTIPRIR